MGAGREFRFLEVMGVLNVLALFQFNRERVGNRQNACYAQSMLWKELLILTDQSTCRDSIYKIGKARKHFFDGGVGEGRIVD